MKNTHLDHPEDAILSGDLSVFDWLLASSDLSVKIDGSPAIVWGRNPANGKFFVGTKSVFNKVKIKINHSHEEIDKNHEGPVADILHVCFDYLPRTHRIIQGDFIGFGGDDCYQPNTVVYAFDDLITQEIIIAPHTLYHAEKDLRDAHSFPLTKQLPSNQDVLFVQPDCHLIQDDMVEIVDFARQMSYMVPDDAYLSGRKLAAVKKQLNMCIRAEMNIQDDEFDCDPNLIRLWKLVHSIKMDMLYLCRCNGPAAYLDGECIDAEGYVRINDYGSYKLVDRDQFSRLNFLKHN